MFRVEATRGDQVESLHRVSLAVTDADGRLVASAGNPDLVTFWRSAAKPFQAMPLVEDGAAAAFGFDDRHLALACASHSSEPRHRALAAEMLERAGVREADLACGPHPPISAQVAAEAARDGTPLTPLWSNCSGKHAGMLALAKFRGWPLAGYQLIDHQLQQRIRAEVARWSGVPEERQLLGVDGCTVVSFALPLRAMALAYARFATSGEPAARRLRDAMGDHPELIAGTDRVETDLGVAAKGLAIAKVGADGIYCVALPQARLGLALKVEDGDMDVAPVALLDALRQLGDVVDLGFAPARLSPSVTRHARPDRLDTRGGVIGMVRPAGTLRFGDAGGVVPPSP
jgi:L-asparaginase II